VDGSVRLALFTHSRRLTKESISLQPIRLLYGKDPFRQTSIDFETSHIKSQSSDESTPVHASNESSDKVNIKEEKIKYKSKLNYL
jgi:hypothetical protein